MAIIFHLDEHPETADWRTLCNLWRSWRAVERDRRRTIRWKPDAPYRPEQFSTNAEWEELLRGQDAQLRRKRWVILCTGVRFGFSRQMLVAWLTLAVAAVGTWAAVRR